MCRYCGERLLLLRGARTTRAVAVPQRAARCTNRPAGRALRAVPAPRHDAGEDTGAPRRAQAMVVGAATRLESPLQSIDALSQRMDLGERLALDRTLARLLEPRPRLRTTTRRRP